MITSVTVPRHVNAAGALERMKSLLLRPGRTLAIADRARWLPAAALPGVRYQRCLPRRYSLRWVKR